MRGCLILTLESAVGNTINDLSYKGKVTNNSAISKENEGAIGGIVKNINDIESTLICGFSKL